jgi:cell division protein FtsQ
LLDKAQSLKSQVAGATWVGNRRWDLRFRTGETLALPEGEELAAQALVNFTRMDGIHRLLERNIIHFDLRDPDRMYMREAPKLKPVEQRTEPAAPVSGKAKDSA